MASARADRPQLREVRRVLRGRQSRANAGEVSYRLYMAVMVVIVVVAPVARIGVLGFAETYAGGDPAVVAACTAAVTALLVLAGAQGGPAYAPLAPLDLLFTTAIPRARLFARPVTRGLIVGAVVGMLISGLIVVARAIRDDMTGELAVASLLMGAAIGTLAALGMLVGQLGRGIRWLLAAALLLLAAAQLLGGFRLDPWSLAASTVLSEASASAGGAGSLFASGAVLLCALLLMGIAPRIAALMRWEALREQAARWDVILVSAGTGDPKAALDRLGAPVRVGRRWHLRVSRGLTLAILRRDLLGMLRTPARSLLGLVGVVLALGLWLSALGINRGFLAEADPVRAGLLGGLALLITSVALQPWCRGLAAAAEGVGSSPLLPVSPQGLLARHLVAPFALAGLIVVLGAVVCASSGILTGAVTLGVACSSVVLVCCALALRTLAALKGSIPLRLLAPIPTPMGDASGINVALWMIDGPVLAVLIGALLGLLWAAGLASSIMMIWAAAISVVVIAAILLWARGRLSG
ncbi:hypothetical protein G7068_15050 [Leucobacter viscericola]|uniref:ABC-2 type transport system permease protein n=1 Tax=Leucobacter viscericola TaxID=2714935 RepID=A0A6G7XIR5_9MICO|nr:hypothetical protein [Leucobacter viscericola]QIK64376.1 hypothetical protein G7068_15050 [Leucobacter viscericola]